MKITESGQKALDNIQKTLDECKGQETQIKAFAFLGAYSTAVMSWAWAKDNRPDHKDLINKLAELVKYKESVPTSIDFKHDIETFSAVLKQTAKQTDRISGFAYKYAHGKLSESVAWVKISQPENKDLLKKTLEPLNGYHQDRSHNISPSIHL